MSKRIIRIGTRDSQLAIWQAKQAEGLLNGQQYQTKIVALKSSGDLNLKTPLYEFGIQGVFTRHLDAALLSGEIDIAVHSMKDVPTVLASGLTIAAILKRGRTEDLLLYKSDTFSPETDGASGVIATGSVRRKAQWLHRYPHSTVVGLRGNINTRLKKLEENNWTGALFAAAGLERIHLIPDKAVALDWMLPAPAQGAIVVVCRADDTEMIICCASLNDEESRLCTQVERDFLKTLLGGCATPISALAQIKGSNIHFKGNMLTPDGRQKVAIEKHCRIEESLNLGVRAGEEILTRKEAQEILSIITQ